MSIPSNPGFKPVDQATFVAWLRTTTSNVHPSTGTSPVYDRQEGYTKTWKDLRTNEVVGYSTNTKFHLREDLVPLAARKEA